jgi:parallel beta-helix repeat protein
MMNDENTQSEHSEYDLQLNALSWNKSDYINYTGPTIHYHTYMDFRIYVNDQDPNYNWSVWVQNYTWCTGSGSFSDPYVIEGLYINGGGFGGMVYIRYSSKFFIIRNNWFDFTGSREHDVGVLMHSAGNGTIKENIFTYNHVGLTFELSTHNNTIVDNIIISDHSTAGTSRGVHISSGAHNNSVLRNKIRDCYSGIYIGNGDEIIIDGNYAENNIWPEDYTGHPIYLRETNNSQLLRNVLAGSFASGTFEINQIDCSGNVVLNNTVIAGDTWDFGPETASLGIPQISQGTANTITLDGSHNNLIAHNRMLGDVSGGAIPGFDIFILVGMVGIISVLLAIAKRKNSKF